MEKDVVKVSSAFLGLDAEYVVHLEEKIKFLEEVLKEMREVRCCCICKHRLGSCGCSLTNVCCEGYSQFARADDLNDKRVIVDKVIAELV